MKVEVLEDGNLVVNGAVLRSSLIHMIEDMQNGDNCDINRWISTTENHIGSIIDLNTASGIEDKEAVDLIRYFRFIRKVFEEFKTV